MEINYTKIEFKGFRIIPHAEGIKRYAKFYTGGIRAGFPSPANDFIEERLSLDERYLSKPESTFFAEVEGDSMYPTLMDKDLLIIRSDLKLVNNKIGIISVNNHEYTIKRFDKRNEQLIADNVNFQNIKLIESDTISCMGVVKHFIRDLY